MNTRAASIASAASASSSSSFLATPAARDDAGKLLLRLAIGVLVLLHGIFKISAGVGFVSAMLAKAGLPGGLAYLVYVGEIVAPLLMIAGFWTRAAAGVVVINMLAAFGLVHMADLFALTKQGGWALELQGLYLFGALAVVLLGAGRFSLGGLRGRWN
ncbi:MULTISPECIES: DoxX family protein [Variovorax]|uniref:Oxidoreductase n=2 Tax=Variovorax paradoxus TaxID=34073 RepID=A0AAW8EM39_VARPD|nr:DoxX family protein [Variovorax paradoxus]MBW8719560.1 DoxX family protein [Variovorax paradoxus]MDP9973584.1 putative oxidoreductase [Variovorax paradoxus]